MGHVEFIFFAKCRKGGRGGGTVKEEEEEDKGGICKEMKSCAHEWDAGVHFANY